MATSSSPPPTTEINRKRSWVENFPIELPDDPNHPLQIALRTYALALSSSLGPALLPFVIAVFGGGSRSKGRTKSLQSVLRKELGPNGFAFAITIAVGGGAALWRFCQFFEESGEDTDNDSSSDMSGPSSDAYYGANGLDRNAYRTLRKWIISAPRKAFMCNLISSTIAVILLHGKGRSNRSKITQVKNVNIPLTMPIDANAVKHGPSPTLDLTFLLLVRAVDSTIQSLVFRKSESYWSRAQTTDILGANGEALVSRGTTVEVRRKKEEETKWRQMMTTRIDAFIFWACSARSVIYTLCAMCRAHNFS